MAALRTLCVPPRSLSSHRHSPPAILSTRRSRTEEGRSSLEGFPRLGLFYDFDLDKLSEGCVTPDNVIKKKKKQNLYICI